MDVKVYLPDELGKRAKAEGLALSQMLRSAVIDELERKRVMTETLADTEEYLLDLEDDEGRRYKGRVTGVELCDGMKSVYLTEDERVILYDSYQHQMHEIGDPAEELSGVLPQDDYLSVLHALGITPVIDV